MELAHFQRLIDDIYGARDRSRGVSASFQWLVEEVGELAKAIRQGERKNIEEEFADVLAWLASLASMCDVDLEQAARAKYPGKCIKCGGNPCACSTNPKLKM